VKPRRVSQVGNMFLHMVGVMFPSREHRSHGKESPVPLMSAADRRTAAPGGC
ncbi:hypothetical protein AVEN_17090-1, partial [Araneus ventricosus]